MLQHYTFVTLSRDTSTIHRRAARRRPASKTRTETAQNISLEIEYELQHYMPPNHYYLLLTDVVFLFTFVFSAYLHNSLYNSLILLVASKQNGLQIQKQQQSGSVRLDFGAQITKTIFCMNFILLRVYDGLHVNNDNRFQ